MSPTSQPLAAEAARSTPHVPPKDRTQEPAEPVGAAGSVASEITYTRELSEADREYAIEFAEVKELEYLEQGDYTRARFMRKCAQHLIEGRKGARE